MTGVEPKPEELKPRADQSIYDSLEAMFREYEALVHAQYQVQFDGNIRRNLIKGEVARTINEINVANITQRKQEIVDKILRTFATPRSSRMARPASRRHKKPVDLDDYE